MILLRTVTEIKASPEQIFDWFAHFRENYVTWHPDHVACRYVKGSFLKEGSIVYCEEYLHGHLYKFKFHITKIIPQSRVDYKASLGLGGGAFIVKPDGTNVLFIAEIYIGPKIPLLGWGLDRFIQIVFSDTLKAAQQHTAEEGENLKKYMERDVHSSTSPASVADLDGG